MIFAQRGFIIICFALLFSGNAFAVSLDHECEPKGLIAKGKEAWDPKAFWTKQIKEIKEYVEAQKTAFRLSIIERKRDIINERLDDEEMKTMGIEQYSDPELDRTINKTDRELLRMQLQMVKEAIEWGCRCTEHAKKKLSQVK